MKIVMYGAPLGDGGYLTEIPFLLNGRIKRICKDAAQIQDLEADIAIANFTRSPLNSGNETGWNYLRLPKVKVQLAIQAEHFDEYIPEWVDGITHNFDGSICYPFNRPFWDFDDSIHPCFARSYWSEKQIQVKPCFYFDPLVKWNNFYQGAVKTVSHYGYTIGAALPHRDQIIKGNPQQFRYMFGDMRNPAKQAELRKSGIGFNIHKFELRGLHPETDGQIIKYLPKTEAIRLSFYYNLGMAIVTEKLDRTFPMRLRNCITEVDDMASYKVDKEQLLAQAKNTEFVFNQYQDLDYELDVLINNIVKTFNL